MDIHYILCIIIFVLLVIYCLLKCKVKEDMLAFNKINTNDYKIYHYDDNCVLRCGDQHSCMRLKYRTDNFLKCKKCKKDNKYLYHDIVNYNCQKEKDKFKNEVKCNFDIGLGCPNYNNISSQKMIQPYYIMKKKSDRFSKTKYSDFNIIDKCEFCWNFN